MKSTTIEILLLLLAAFSSCSVMQPQDSADKEGPFFYDWHTLRVGGLVFAGVLCFLGIVILLIPQSVWLRKVSLEDQTALTAESSKRLPHSEIPAPPQGREMVPCHWWLKGPLLSRRSGVSCLCPVFFYIPVQ
ncbi:hypothetical protein lerEdw1_009810 [Lerista edwardsae]|nr:hypothetical protein lerEdw1_009810 [Lerista edwardsae]